MKVGLFFTEDSEDGVLVLFIKCKPGENQKNLKKMKIGIDIMIFL